MSELLGGSVAITTRTLPAAAMESQYNVRLAAEGGVPPYRWTLQDGWLPSGLALQQDGVLAGIPELPGEFHFTVQVADSSNPVQTASKLLRLAVPSHGPSILTSNPELPWAQVSHEYLIKLTAAGGLPPFTWKALSTMPEGLKLSANGLVSGTPVRGGDFVLDVRASDLRAESTHRQFRLHVSPAAVDRFGGVLALRSPRGGTGSWRVEKIGKRWVLITPEGNAFWMTMVWFLNGDGHKDERGGTYDARTTAKYGLETIKWVQANRRLKAWGFNAIGPYSYRMVLPNDEESDWGGTQPVKLPFVGMGPNPAITGRKEGVFKNLYARLDPDVRTLGDQGSANFPDVFDPAWVHNTWKLYNEDKDLAFQATSPYFIGAFSDDTDFISGFGSGTDFPTDPPDKSHAHLGYVALVTAPEQLLNLYSASPGQPYADPKVYTKLALRDFLRARYGTIGVLNAAWGSTYTTFDNDGGWPNGKGLLDENGRLEHRWLGTGNPELSASAHANPEMVSDLDEFLYQIARQFFSVERAAYKKAIPNALFFGPSSVGAWWSPARAPILRAAAEALDILSVSSDCSREQLDFVTGVTGDIPFVTGIGSMANPDSSQWRHGRAEEKATWAAKDQPSRGRRYRDNAESLFVYRSAVGTNPATGILWWAWTDSVPEERNWGLVSLMDNAYDGWEDGIAQGTDAWGFPTGGEEKNYGDFLGPVRQENFSIVERLADAH